MAIGAGMAMNGFLFAMQAAGLIVSKRESKNQLEMIKIGRDLEKAQYSANLENIRLASSEESLSEMIALRKNLGTQIANNAAKGNRGGSSYNTINESVHNFDEDERVRRLNLLSQESQLRAADIVSGLHTLESETELGQAMNKKVLDTIPVSGLLSSVFNSKKKSTVPTLPNPFGNESTFNWGI